MATRGKKVEIYYTSQGTTTGVDSSALLFDGKNLAIITHGKTFKGTDTWEAATTSQEGYVPQLASGGGSIATQASEYVLTYKDGVDSTPTWKLLPTNAFLDTNDDTWIAADVNNAGYVPHSVKGKYLHANDSTGALEWVDDHTYTVNNNTFRIKSLVGSTTTTLSDFTANQASDDDFTLVQGSNITFTVDATNRKLTIAGTANTWKAANASQEGYVPKTTANKILRTNNDGAVYWGDDSNTWKAANTSQEGYVPQLATGGGTIATQASEYVLTFKSGTDTTPVWRLLPANAYNDHTYTVNNNTYRIKSKIGDSTTTLSDFTANQASDDDFTLIQGSNITFTNDTTNRTLTIAGTANTWKPANTSQEGYAPKLATGGGTIGTQASEYVLTFKSGTDTAPVWRLLPSNAFNDHTYTVNNATYSIKSLVGSTTTTISDFTANQSGNDDFTLAQGSNITFTVDATNRKLTIAGTANTWTAVSSTADGYVPKIGTAAAATIGTQSTEWVLTSTSGGTPSWRALPANAFKNDNTWKAANASQEGYVPKSTANKILRSNGDGALYWGDDTNTWRPVGTGASDAAAGNHTHGISIATDSGTNQITLAHATKYKLTAGGQSYIFTTPSDNNTDTKVSQVDNNDNAARPILVKNGTGTGTVTDSALFADGVTVNPSNNSLSISGNLSVTGTASFSNNVTTGGTNYLNAAGYKSD